MNDGVKCSLSKSKLVFRHQIIMDTVAPLKIKIEEMFLWFV